MFVIPLPPPSPRECPDEVRTSMTGVQDVAKWEAYHCAPTTPPWESTEVFAGLPPLLEKLARESMPTSSKKKAIEFGCGASKTAVWLAEQAGWEVTGVDISPRAIERATILDSRQLVRWVQADVLRLPGTLPAGREEDGSFDLVFDMQCFHFLRDIDRDGAVEAISNCLKPGGTAVIVVGAPNPEAANGPGPCRLTRQEFVDDFAAGAADLELVSLTLSSFNPTPFYDAHFSRPPPCWIGTFRKKVALN